MAQLSRIKRSSLSQSVYDQLKRLIIQHEIEPGGKIGLGELAASLDVSLTPLREALTKLKQEGFVVHHPHRGYFVAEITVQEARELYEVREALELHALALGLPKLEEKDLLAIEGAVEGYRRVVNQPERDRFLEDKKLHLRLAAPAGNQLLLRILEQVLDRIIMKLRIESLPRERGPAAHGEHLDILEGIRRRDVAEACGRLRKHLRNSREYVLAFLAGQDNEPASR